MYAVITLQQNFKLTIITAITPLTLHLEIERLYRVWSQTKYF
jgi:hypothetical protein